MNYPAKQEPTLINLKVHLNEKRDMVRKCLNGICADYSIPAPPTSIMDRLVSFVIEAYPTIRLSEITKAFNLNAAGKEWEMVRAFGSLDKPFLGDVISKYLLYRREHNKRNTEKNRDYAQMPWTPKDSFDQVFAHKEKHGHFPKTIGVYHWAYEHAVQSGEMKHDQKEWKKAVEWATKNIDKLDDEFLLVISKGREDDIMRLAKKHLFTKHYEK